MIKMRAAKTSEFEKLQQFLVSQGSNPWNYLPKEAVTDQFQRLNIGQDKCIVALQNTTVVGLVIYRQPGDIPIFFEHHISFKKAIYVAEVVVHNKWSGRGIGTDLLNEVSSIAQLLSVEQLLADRHEQNAASAGMLNKAGFIEIDCFLDSERRSVGSRKTCILSLALATV